MKPETDAYLSKSRECLAKAEWVLPRWPDVAGREAYLAGLHAAQALIFERTGIVITTHGGVQGEFGRLTKDEPRCDRDLRKFLGRTYNLKAIADYGTGPDSEVTSEEAQEAIETATRFISCIEELLTNPATSQ